MREMVTFPEIGIKGKACKQIEAAAAAAPFNTHMFHISSWPWESQEELELYDKEEESALMELEECLISPPLHPHNYSTSTTKILTPARHKVLYSLSSGAHSSTRSVISSSRSSCSRSCTQSTSSPSTIEKFTRLWDDDDEYELGQRETTQLPPIHPSDYLKTLLCQLAASISSIKTAYAHQQTTLNPYNMRAINGQAEEGGGDSMDVISATDKAMVEELERLSHLHSQLALLPHMLTFKEGAEAALEAVKKDSMMKMEEQLKRYEGIITRFHEEMRRKEAVVEALKATLAKSMLNGEKLQQRVKALEATRATLHTHS